MKEDLKPRNEKGEYHGYCEVYFKNGDLFYKGNHKADIMVALWVWSEGGLENKVEFWI